MAILHKGSTISPTKPEILEKMLGGPVEVVGSYRFDDPEGAVGVEGFVVRRGDGTRHVVLTYRDAALEGAQDHLVATMQHSELGSRWVYDGKGDPVAVECFRRAVLGEQDQAPLELWEGDRRVGELEPTVRLTAQEGDPGDQSLTIVEDLDADLDDLQATGARLEAEWDGGRGVIAFIG